jgi:hypothetical protein
MRSIFVAVLSLLPMALCLSVGCGDPIPGDTDSDGVQDAADFCPDTPAGQDVNEQGCAASEMDTDADGVTDDVDNCPSAINTGQEDEDDDGVGNACDACPKTPDGLHVDETGCPA